MLELNQPRDVLVPERVAPHPVETVCPGTESRVLLLGDSYTNVYSRPELHWGEEAGLGRQLAAALGQPVEVLAVNDRGAYATREALAAELSRGRQRLLDKQVVVWQFAVRELSFGDWRLVALPAPASGEAFGAAPARRLRVQGVVEAAAALPGRPDTPYREAIRALRLGSLEVAGHGLHEDALLVYTWSMRDGRPTAGARVEAGDRLSLELVPWSEVADDYGTIMRFELLDDRSLALQVYWAEEVP
jgi:alginate O-acetyltransferase complex protein AlgJ